MSDSGWDYGIFWDEIINQLQHEISEQEFRMWFDRLSYLRASESIIILAVPSNFYRDQVKARYQSVIQAKLHEISGRDIKIDFEIAKMPDKPTKIIPPAQPSFSSPPPEHVSPTTTSVHDQIREPEQPRREIRQAIHPLLNPFYCFENFVIGDNNSFAANAAVAIAKNPGRAYNPCLIYGGVGLGKTHLLQSVGNYVYQASPEKKILYISMENFTNDFVQSIKEGKMAAFKARYRSVDVLLIDDIHFIQNKNETQEELFFTFEALFQNSKQMIFSCDRPIADIKDISDRLRSRFQRGITVDLQPPSFETRLAILKKKCDLNKLYIPDESLTILCEAITTNVRDLESGLTKLQAYAELVSKEITPQITRQLLKDFLVVSSQKNITLDTILRTVALYFNMSASDMKSKRRTRAVAFPRQIAMYIAREITEYSTTEIGLEFGGRDHTTVMHACGRINDRKKTDPTLEPLIQDLLKKIKSEGTKS